MPRPQKSLPRAAHPFAPNTTAAHAGATTGSRGRAARGSGRSSGRRGAAARRGRVTRRLRHHALLPSSRPSVPAFARPRAGSSATRAAWEGPQVMSAINITGVQVLNNPACFLDSIQFDISYEVLFNLPHGA